MPRNKIGILMENRFIEQEIIYYSNRFKEEGLEAIFLTRLWGQDRLTFKGLEFGMPFTVENSFEDIKSLDEYAAVIVPAGYVADMLRYDEKPGDIAPAVKFMADAMKDKDVIKACICHSLWIFDHVPEVIKGRRVTCHNNIFGSVKNTGAAYVDSDVVSDGDFITARTGAMFSELSRTIIEEIKRRRAN